MAEDEMVECHHRLNGREFQQALGVGEGQGSLACYSHKKSDTTERLNNSNNGGRLPGRRVVYYLLPNAGLLFSMLR